MNKPRNIIINGTELVRFEGNVVNNIDITPEEFERRINEVMLEAVKKAEIFCNNKIYNNSSDSILNKKDSLYGKEDGKNTEDDPDKKKKTNKTVGLNWTGGYDAGSLLKESAQTETPFLDDRNYVENMHASSNLINYLKQWEGMHGTTNPAKKEYYDRAGHKWTIGYGHVETGNERKKYGKGITPEQAETILEYDIIHKGENPVKELFKGCRFTQNEFDALVDLSFNSGQTTMNRSTVASLIKNHSTDKYAISAAFKEVSKRASERKSAESTMYTGADYPAPSYLKNK